MRLAPLLKLPILSFRQCFPLRRASTSPFDLLTLGFELHLCLQTCDVNVLICTTLFSSETSVDHNRCVYQHTFNLSTTSIVIADGFTSSDHSCLHQIGEQQVFRWWCLLTIQYRPSGQPGEKKREDSNARNSLPWHHGSSNSSVAASIRSYTMLTTYHPISSCFGKANRHLGSAELCSTSHARHVPTIGGVVHPH